MLKDGVIIPVIDHFEGEYAFLSNFYPAEVTYLGVTYPTVEHAYQSAKTLVTAQKNWVRTAPTPGEAKKRGQRVTMRPSWNESARRTVMSGLLHQKFEHEPLRSKLLATGDTELVEGNVWHDQFWGDCRCPQHIGQGGLNWLGSLLMKIRAEMAK